jgi:hypothetical protein
MAQQQTFVANVVQFGSKSNKFQQQNLFEGK